MAAAPVRFMAEALRLAHRGLYTTDPNPRVGCVVVKDQTIIGRGWHAKAGHDHAEVRALQQAGDAAAGSSLYISLEPCCFSGRTPPCTHAIVQAGISEVYTAMLDPHPQVSGKGIAILRQAGLKITTGLLAAEAHQLNIGFINRWQKGVPWLRAKLAMGLEGATGYGDSERTIITGSAAQYDGHRWRARSSAMITSAKTVAADNALLTARLTDTEVKQPLRILIDSHFKLSPDADFFAQDERVLWVGSERSSPPQSLPPHTQIYQLPSDKHGLCLVSLMEHLAGLEMNEVMIEAGPKLTASFLRSGLVDELILYIAPRLLGPNMMDSLHLEAETQQFVWHDVRFVGDDLRLVLRRPLSC